MADSDKVLKHPDLNEITKKLLSGESVREVESWLKRKYNKAPRYWISYMTLQKYRKDHLNIKGEVLDKIQVERKEISKSRGEQRNVEIVKNLPARSEAISKISENLLDTEDILLDMKDKVYERIKLLEQQNVSHNNEKAIAEYINQLRGILQDYYKILDLTSGREAKGNINIEIATQQINSIKEAVRETLAELAPDLVPAFLQKLQDKMRRLNISFGEESHVNININSD